MHYQFFSGFPFFLVLVSAYKKSAVEVVFQVCPHESIMFLCQYFDIVFVVVGSVKNMFLGRLNYVEYFVLQMFGFLQHRRICSFKLEVAILCSQVFITLVPLKSEFPKNILQRYNK